ncbi:MAG: L,D-transpeptidase family protein [Anaerolineales bacterium]|nr:L,D-transpeptidase family protein [Anaerolineales bacterium]
MNDRFVESREALSYAREALKNGAIKEARQWAERSAELAPQSEDPWLILAAVASPRESVEYIRKALEVSPDSPRAKKGMEWALQRLGETPKSNVNPQNEKQAKVTNDAQPKNQVKNAGVKNPKKKRSPLLPILLGVVGLAVLLFAAWSAVTSPVLASILSLASAQPVERQPFAQVDIAKPSVANTPVALQPVEQVVIPTATSVPTATAQPEIAVIPATDTQVVLPTNTPVVEVPTTTPEATSVPGVLVAEIVADTPTPEFSATAVVPDIPLGIGNGGEHWIDVDLSQQRVYAYEGDTVVNTFVVSTGTWQTPTVTGKYNV